MFSWFISPLKKLLNQPLNATAGLFSSGTRLFQRANRVRWSLPVAMLLMAFSPSVSLAAELDGVDINGATKKTRDRIIAKGIKYLKTKGQAFDGSYSGFTGIGVTALATTAMLKNGLPVEDAQVGYSLAFLEKQAQPDGGIYLKGTFFRNYETCLTILCLTEANRAGRYDKILRQADGFLKKLQWDEGEVKDDSDYAFGGAGYGKHKRPDLSNTQFLIEALLATGNGENSPELQRALLFVSRCQNLESEHNESPFAKLNPDGGFYYTVAAGGSSQAGETAEGGLRSYASMTYAGLKSMIYAGVGPEDKRVKAAVEWIRKNYDLSSNPGLGNAGLYYYYHTFAKTLAAMEVDEFVDANGKKHNWRAEIIHELARRQQPDGSWINKKSPRWLESDANLVTSYALLALSYCQDKTK